ncbi:hypothetical protein Hanom_Chr01g00040351 [Helianthus anomalus]
MMSKVFSDTMLFGIEDNVYLSLNCIKKLFVLEIGLHEDGVYIEHHITHSHYPIYFLLSDKDEEETSVEAQHIQQTTVEEEA